MRLFSCNGCGQVLHFENTVCLRCGRHVGYVPDGDRMLALDPDGEVWAEVDETGAVTADRRWRFCRNWELSACNWLVPAEHDHEGLETEFCAACRHNRTVPDLSDPVNHQRWQKIEVAKRRLIYSLIKLGLPLPVPGDGHPQPLAFDFLAEDPGGVERVLTGHADGLVTISLTEADDATREKMRSEMGEAYRTLLGHFRHEVGHYYWDILVRDGGRTEDFRAMFGDESADYAAALQRHYHEGAPPGWAEEHVSAYSTMHPWEDWAETWAHYLHMVDTLETARALGVTIEPDVDPEGDLSSEIDVNSYRSTQIGPLLSAWTPLTVALNMLARSMGQLDPYPFVLPEPVRAKLGFVHDLVAAQRQF